MIVKFGSLFKTPCTTGTKEYLGGKGYGLVRMAEEGLNIPSGIIIPTSACVESMHLSPADRFAYVKDLVEQHVMPALEELEDSLGYSPLYSVRSGARVSMPGMMDTILNVGMTDSILPLWVERLGDRAAYDCYRRLLSMVGEVALSIPKDKFEKKHAHIMTLKGGKGKNKLSAPAKSESDLTVFHFRKMVEEYKKIIEVSRPNDYSHLQSVVRQLQMCVLAVFASWNNERAVTYRKLNNIPEDWGTAVVIQMMVFGNMNDQSGSGVLFSRDPATGNNAVVGEFLPKAQGEDVVAGIRTPMKLEEMQGKGIWGGVYKELTTTAKNMEAAYKDMQDMEFTVQDGQLYWLQTRSGKRSAQASFKIAVDLVKEQIMTKDEVFARIDRKAIEAVGVTKVSPSFTVPPDAVGIPAGGSVVSGKAVFSSEQAMDTGSKTILITKETTPDDIAGMNAAVGILTATGGATSHAAVVSRSMNKSCVVGCGSLKYIFKSDATLVCPNGENKTILPSTIVTIDGSTGRVWVGVEVPVEKSEGDENYEQLVEWAFDGKDIVELIRADKPAQLAAGKSYAVSVEGIPNGEFIKPMHELMESARKMGCKLLVSLYEGSDIQEPEDEPLWMIFSSKITFGTSKALDLASLPTNLCNNVTLFLPPRLRNDTKVVGTLRKHGYKFGGEVHSIEDLLNANGPVIITPDLVKAVGGGAVFDQLTVILKNGGLEICDVPKVSTRRKVLIDMLSKVG